MATNVAAGAAVAGVKRPMVPAVAAALSERFGARYVTSMAVREHHGRDESAFDITPPDAVVYALTTEDVAFVLALANSHGTPVIAYGAGSSLEGHLLAVQMKRPIVALMTDQAVRQIEQCRDRPEAVAPKDWSEGGDADDKRSIADQERQPMLSEPDDGQVDPARECLGAGRQQRVIGRARYWRHAATSPVLKIDRAASNAVSIAASSIW